jgi:hypothetical protein
MKILSGYAPDASVRLLALTYGRIRGSRKRCLRVRLWPEREEEAGRSCRR